MEGSNHRQLLKQNPGQCGVETLLRRLPSKLEVALRRPRFSASSPGCGRSVKQKFESAATFHGPLDPADGFARPEATEHLVHSSARVP